MGRHIHHPPIMQSQENNSCDASVATGKSERRTIDLVLAFTVTFAPPVAFVLGGALWYAGMLVPDASDLFIMVALHALTIMGVELGYHRLFAHKSYVAVPWLRTALAALGSMAFQGPVIWWASVHRKHHRFTDKPGDPHSMYLHDEHGGFTWQGALHAHVGWIWSARNVGRGGLGGFADLARDLYTDRSIFWVHMKYNYFLAAGLLLPVLLSGLMHRSLSGLLIGLLWGGLIRLFFANHLSYWCLNSVLHGMGKQAYATGDRSTNFAPLTFLTFGQAFHNNHHAYPAAAVMRHKAGEIDPGAWLLYTFRRLGWVHEMVLPPKDLGQRLSLRTRRDESPVQTSSPEA